MAITLCDIKGCVFYGRYCRLHAVSGKEKKVHVIKPRSEKLAKVMKKEYVPQVKEMVAKNTACAVKSPVCTGKAQGFHHLVGREGKNLTGKKKIPCCNKCNGHIESNDAWARSQGLKLSKHSNYKRSKT